MKVIGGGKAASLLILRDAGGKVEPIRDILIMEDRFRLSVKRFFVTFPRIESDVGIDSCREKLLEQSYFQKIDFAVIAEEDHSENDGRHLHLLLVFKRKHDVRRADYFDALTGKHGSMESVRDFKACLKYLMKDGKYIGVNIETKLLEEMTLVGMNNSEVVANMVLLGRTEHEIMHEHPGFYLQNKRKIQDMITEVKRENKQRRLIAIGEPKLGLNMMSNTLNAASIWIEDAIKCGRGEIDWEFGHKQLWIKTETGAGKTTLIRTLEKIVNVWFVPNDEHFYDFYEDDSSQVMVIEEFKDNTKSITWLNAFMDGQTMNLRKKGSQVIKYNNHPCIVLSNMEMRDCFPTVGEELFKALKRRVLYIAAGGDMDESSIRRWLRMTRGKIEVKIAGPVLGPD